MAKRGRKPTYRLKNKTCPNPDCPFHGQTGKRNIVSNGGYFNRGGNRIQRFQCNNCGTSFCSRSNTIFYDLRSPEEQVVIALRMLLKGFPLRRVSAFMKVKLDTVRGWLQLIEKPDKKIDAWLIKEARASKEELNALRTFMETKSLRQRAGLCWNRYRSRSSLPKDILR